MRVKGWNPTLDHAAGPVDVLAAATPSQRGGSRVRPLALNVTEAQFTNLVLDVARLFGWRAHHQRPAFERGKYRSAIQGDVGFVDLVLCNGQRVIFAELKVGKNRPTDAQTRWLTDLREAGQEVYVWRPDDWPEIESTLRRETR